MEGDTKETANSRGATGFFFFIFYESRINEDRDRFVLHFYKSFDPYPLETEGSSVRPLDYTHETRERISILI